MIGVVMAASSHLVAQPAPSILSRLSDEIEAAVKKTRQQLATVLVSDPEQGEFLELPGVWLRDPNCPSGVIVGRSLPKAARLQVRAADGKLFVARLHAQKYGIAVVQLDVPKGIANPAHSLPCSGDLRPGRMVIAVGLTQAAAGLLEGPGSAEPERARQWRLQAWLGHPEEQTIVVDDRGQWLGLTGPKCQEDNPKNRKLDESAGSNNNAPPATGSPYRHDLAPATEVLGLATYLVREAGPRTKDRRPMLGIMLEPVEPALASHLKLPPGHGVIVQSLAAGGLADRVGLRVHDILVTVDDATVEGLQSFIRWFDGKQAGNRVAVVVLRCGERKRIEFVLE